MEFQPGVVVVNGVRYGFIRETERGFLFLPYVFGRRMSRKYWPTPTECVPAWVKQHIKARMAKGVK